LPAAVSSPRHATPARRRRPDDRREPAADASPRRIRRRLGPVTPPPRRDARERALRPRPARPRPAAWQCRRIRAPADGLDVLRALRSRPRRDPGDRRSLRATSAATASPGSTPAPMTTSSSRSSSTSSPPASAPSCGAMRARRAVCCRRAESRSTRRSGA
jgi:hypothetical protein